MDTQHRANQRQLEECLFAMLETPNMKAKKDLRRFYENCRKAYAELDKEMVECRRRQRITHKYTELQAQFDECIKHFEQWLIMAKLLY
jgi:hypothetical protein